MLEGPNIIYYADHKSLEREASSARPLNVVFLTSIRDVGSCDRNGIETPTRNEMRYMEGAIQRVISETYRAGSLFNVARVAGVITDDIESDLKDKDIAYPVEPTLGQNWIHPYDLRTPEGTLVREITHNIPSSFRALPLDAEIERRQQKYQFEAAVLQKTQDLGGDVIVSDHYMARIDYLVGGALGYFGRVLNIHPAVTIEGHPFCFRGKTPTVDAINRAREEGSPIKTGATLHIVDWEIDKGPAIAYTADTPVYPDDKPEWLRYRNYQRAKLPLLIEGFRHYAEAIYPNLNRINLAKMQPISKVQHTSNGYWRSQAHEGFLYGQV
jgi:folate-dependent phosphoribosylglycinamide formyltransferase PurN